MSAAATASAGARPTAQPPGLRKLGRFAGASLLAAVLAWAATTQFSLLAHLENKTIDLRSVALAPPQPKSDQVVVLGITEETLAGFAYRSPVDRAFLAKTIQLLEDRQVKAIYLDVLIDQPTEEAKDKALYQVLRETKTPLRVAFSNDPAVVNEEQLAFLQAYVPSQHWSAVNLSSDPIDGTARWFFSGLKPGDRGLTQAVLPVPFAISEAIGHRVDPPRGNAERRIAWRQPQEIAEGSFPLFPAHALPVLPADWFKDKVVLVGAVLSITDRHRTPFAIIDDGRLGMMSGVEIFAHQTSAVLEGEALEVPGLLEALSFSLAAGFLGGLLGLLGLGTIALVGLGLGLVLVYWLVVLLGVEHGLAIVPLFPPTFALLAAMFASVTLVGREERERRKFVQSAFSRYVEPAVVNQLVSQPELLSLTGEKRRLSFIFTDIHGFTTLSEQISPEQLTVVLNQYLDGMCKVVHRHQGIVDKFIGDAVMAFFNAPISQPDHADRAMACAMEMDAFCQAFREQIDQEMGLSLGVTRIGVHSGDAIVGNFGAENRMDFTCLGDTVNAASRVEGVNKYFGTRVCLTQGVVDNLLRPSGRYRPVGDVMLKGKDTALRLYEPVAEADWETARVQGYLRAFSSLERGDLEALEEFMQLGEQFPSDPLVAFHCRRLAAGQRTSVIRMEEK